jgi:vesicle-associated membrane protein 72
MNGGSSSKQTLIYSFVAKGSVVLAEHTAFSGNFSTIAVQCLQKLPPNSTRSTYSCDGHTFNFLVDRGFGTPTVSLLILLAAAASLSCDCVNVVQCFSWWRRRRWEGACRLCS